MKTPGNLRRHYIVAVNWTLDSKEIVIQQLNRLQNNLQLLSADPKSGSVRTILNEKDDARVDVALPEMRWFESGRRFLWNQ